MIIWHMREADADRGAALTDLELVKAVTLHADGPSSTKEVFLRAKRTVVDMDIARAGADVVDVEHEPQAIPDFLSWLSNPIFSSRAMRVGIDLGCPSSDFWPCRFKTNPTEEYFFHLPGRSYDVVDFEKSTFLMTLPGPAPLPMFIQEISLKVIPDDVAPCFRAAIPGRTQLLTELFVRDDYKRAWEVAGFTGATFRQAS